MLKKYLIYSLCLLVLLSTFSCGCNTKISEESQNYLNAVEEFKGYSEMNPYLFENCSEDQWNQAIDKLEADIKKNKLDENDVFYRMQEISAMEKNGHSCCTKINSKQENIFPICGYYCGDDFYITIADSKYKDILGAQIISINGVSFEDIEKKYSKIISAENTQRIRAQISANGFYESAFKYLGILKKNNKFEVKKLNGEIETVTIDSVSYEDFCNIRANTNSYLSYDENLKSIENKKPANSYKQYWYTLDKDNRILYFQYNECLDKYDKEKNDPLIDISNYPDFSEFSTSLVEFMKNNEGDFDKIVVDVSQNTGGFKNHLDSFVNSNLELLNSKKVYVIMSKYTFSAGVFAVNTLVKQCNATMVGEETGGSIQMYAAKFNQLSYMQIQNVIGKDKADLCDAAGKNSPDNMRGAIPDIQVNRTIEDLINGDNPYYQAIIDN